MEKKNIEKLRNKLKLLNEFYIKIVIDTLSEENDPEMVKDFLMKDFEKSKSFSFKIEDIKIFVVKK